MPMVFVEGEGGSHVASNCKCCTGQPGQPIAVTMTCEQARATKKVNAFYQNVSNCSCDQCAETAITPASMGIQSSQKK
ncbi:hypothetical protein DPMN_179153 [Dreissena polymorpha]|uniref:CTCK domain-containing protein n=2 Tax=Dreissena polymorpha TaxID=45954 RepID=A0A9D4EGF6_DREPO|nr:hypothetical protein DPMN_179153 [Dreissena polymorpha]